MKAADARTSAILCHAQITIGKYARQQTKTTGIGSQPVEILWPGAAQRKNPIIYIHYIQLITSKITATKK